MSEVTEKAEALNKKMSNFEAQIEKTATKEALEAVSKELKESRTLSEGNHKELLEKIQKQGETITAMDVASQKAVQKTFKDALSEEIAKNKETIESISKEQGSGKFIVIKAVGAMTTGSQSVPADGIPPLQAVQSFPPSNVNLNGTFIDSLVSIQTTSVASLGYTETVPKDGDYGFVAEGGTKPQIDFKIETDFAKPNKVAAHMVLTEEAVTDIPRLQSIASDYLFKKHNLKREAGIISGDGTGETPKGITSYGRSFVAGSMANKVVSPNVMDVINAGITDIFTTHNYEDETPYMANAVLLNPTNFFLDIVSAKDSRGLPLFPTAALFNRVNIGGVTIYPTEKVAEGKILIADLSKYNVGNYVPYSLRVGWINDQLITNQFTMVGESRFHTWVKKLDEQAFLYDDIATIKAAIQSS